MVPTLSAGTIAASGSPRRRNWPGRNLSTISTSAARPTMRPEPGGRGRRLDGSGVLQQLGTLACSCLAARSRFLIANPSNVIVSVLIDRWAHSFA